MSGFKTSATWYQVLLSQGKENPDISGSGTPHKSSHYKRGTGVVATKSARPRTVSRGCLRTELDSSYNEWRDDTKAFMATILSISHWGFDSPSSH